MPKLPDKIAKKPLPSQSGRDRLPSVDNGRRPSVAKPDQPESVWQGPMVDGITFSLLSRFLVCRERFRLHVVKGLAPATGFNHRIQFGNLWHLCEEMHGQGMAWQGPLELLGGDLCRKYPLEQRDVHKWYNVCRTQFPIYLEYWSRHPDEIDRQPIVREYKFDVPYELPSGRTVRLRGKLDGIDSMGYGATRGLYLLEHKTKGDVDQQQIMRQLSFDLQTMLYLTVLYQDTGCEELEEAKQNRMPILGVRYNVVRRPLSGGKGTISQYKPSNKNPQGETNEQFYARLGKVISANPEYFFMRWRSEVLTQDVITFRRECLDPILEQLCKWWDWAKVWGAKPTSKWSNHHWRHPYGVHNVLDEGGASDLDHYLATGSEIGLSHVDDLFPELA